MGWRCTTTAAPPGCSHDWLSLVIALFFAFGGKDKETNGDEGRLSSVNWLFFADQAESDFLADETSSLWPLVMRHLLSLVQIFLLLTSDETALLLLSL